MRNTLTSSPGQNLRQHCQVGGVAYCEHVVLARQTEYRDQLGPGYNGRQLIHKCKFANVEERQSFTKIN